MDFYVVTYILKDSFFASCNSNLNLLSSSLDLLFLVTSSPSSLHARSSSSFIYCLLLYLISILLSTPSSTSLAIILPLYYSRHFSLHFFFSFFLFIIFIFFFLLSSFFLLYHSLFPPTPFKIFLMRFPLPFFACYHFFC